MLQSNYEHFKKKFWIYTRNHEHFFKNSKTWFIFEGKFWLGSESESIRIRIQIRKEPNPNPNLSDKQDPNPNPKKIFRIPNTGWRDILIAVHMHRSQWCGSWLSWIQIPIRSRNLVSWSRCSSYETNKMRLSFSVFVVQFYLLYVLQTQF